MPPATMNLLDLGAGTSVGMVVEEGRPVVAARPRRRYVLADLLARSDTDADDPAEDRGWTTSGPVGGELL